jgi:hypothetical protein
MKEPMKQASENSAIAAQVTVIESTATEISNAAISLSERTKSVTAEAMQLAMLAGKLLNQANELRKIVKNIV